MKRTLTILLAGILLIFGRVTAAADSSIPQETELVIFAAASMQETLTELQPLFEKQNPGIRLIFSFDSSGTLKTQIREGALCDVFISAGQKQMDQLDITADADKNPDGLDFILPGSRRDLLENRVTLCVPEGSSGIGSFDDLAMRLGEENILLCMGNSDVPVGQYTQKLLRYYNLDEEALSRAGCITYASNVKEVTTQVLQGSVDAGVIYCTDAYSAGLTPVDYATAEMCGQIIYPAAVIRDSANPEPAAQYLDFLAAEEATEVFEKVGFTPVE